MSSSSDVTVVTPEPAFLEAIVSSLDDPVVAVDADLRLLHSNPAADRAFGSLTAGGLRRGDRLPEALIGLGVPNSSALPLWGRALAGERLSARRSLGSTSNSALYDLTLAPLPGPKGAAGAFLIARPVSPAELTPPGPAIDARALGRHQSPERFQLLAETLPQMVWTVSRDGASDYWNRQFREYTGFYERDGGFDAFWEIVHPDDLTRTRRAWEGAQRDPELGYSTEHRLRRQDGEYRWHLSRAIAVRDPDGRAQIWFGTSTDIHEQRRFQEALRLSEERSEVALKAAPVTVFHQDTDLRYTWIRNPLYDLHASAVLGRTDAELFPSDDPDVLRFVELKRRVLDSGKGLRAKIALPAPSGRTNFDLTVEPMYAEDGTIDGITCAAIDITEQVQAQAALERHARHLAAADERKNEFLAMLGHELRNPMAAIANGVRVVARGGPDAEEALPMVERHVAQMTRLLNDLLDISRMTRGRLEVEMELQRMRPIIESAVGALGPRFEELRHELVLEPIPDVLVRIDATRLEQIVSNLLDNAASYTEPGGRIALWVEVGADCVSIHVSDNGRGLSAVEVDTIFEPFVQGGDERRRGLGIGLALVRRLTELHGGRVSVHSDGRGHGSEFVVHLPRPDPSEVTLEADEGAEVDGSTASLEGLRVLAVDDNEDATRFMAILLRDFGCEVTVANDGASCLELATAAQASDGGAASAEAGFDVVLLDIGLPDLNGRDVARRLRALPGYERTLLIAISGFTQHSDVVASLRAGFNTHMGKPVSPEALKAVIERGVAGGRQPTPGPIPKIDGIGGGLTEDSSVLDCDDEETEPPASAALTSADAADLTQLMRQLAHDLRTPINAVIVAAWYLNRHSEDEEMLDIADTLKESGARITSLLDRAVDLARLQLEGPEALVREPCDLRELVAKAAATFPDHGVDMPSADGPPVTGLWDRTRLLRLFEGLFQRVGGPEACGRLRLDADEVEATLEFSGVFPPAGADPAEVPLDTYTVDLRMAHDLAAAHGGRFERRDGPGQRQRLRLVLPRHSPAD